MTSDMMYRGVRIERLVLIFGLFAYYKIWKLLVKSVEDVRQRQERGCGAGMGIRPIHSREFHQSIQSGVLHSEGLFADERRGNGRLSEDSSWKGAALPELWKWNMQSEMPGVDFRSRIHRNSPSAPVRHAHKWAALWQTGLLRCQRSEMALSIPSAIGKMGQVLSDGTRIRALPISNHHSVRSMFYRYQDGHGLPYDPLKAIVSPRPIGWISSRSAVGHVNLAPYAYFNMISTKPCLVMFSSEGYKDSVAFIEETGEFATNLVSAHLCEAMNVTSVRAPKGISEFEYSGLTSADCSLIGAPRVAEAFATLECVLTDIRRPLDRHGNHVNAFMVTGEVVGVHISESILTDGLVDVAKAKPVSRLGYRDFSSVTEVFQMFRPTWDESDR